MMADKKQRGVVDVPSFVLPIGSVMGISIKPKQGDQGGYAEVKFRVPLDKAWQKASPFINGIAETSAAVSVVVSRVAVTLPGLRDDNEE